MHETTRLLRDLVALPSVNPMGRPLTGPHLLEDRVSTYVEGFFHDLGVPHLRQRIAPQRENVLGWYEGPDPRAVIVLEVHQDTVPTDNMTIDPFGARIEDGRLYGRGACDVKGGMAAMLHAFATIVRARAPIPARVVVACTVDEEHTFLGVQQLVRSGWLREPGWPVQVIVAEPTDLNIVDAHKGVVRWYIETSGRSCHSSRPERGDNAIYRMGYVLPLIEEYARGLVARTHPRLGPATLSVGLISGGSSVNTVPDRCRVDIDRRLLPGEVPVQACRELDTFLRARLGDGFPFTSSVPELQMPALGNDLSAGLTARLGEAIDAVVGKHEVHAVPYGTDASTFAVNGIPAVVFGPGDIGKAHTCDEWVSLEEVEQASAILAGFLSRFTPLAG
jgi:acetylornithine deacetylase